MWRMLFCNDSGLKKSTKNPRSGANINMQSSCCWYQSGFDRRKSRCFSKVRRRVTQLFSTNMNMINHLPAFNTRRRFSSGAWENHLEIIQTPRFSNVARLSLLISQQGYKTHLCLYKGVTSLRFFCADCVCYYILRNKKGEKSCDVSPSKWLFSDYTGQKSRGQSPGGDLFYFSTHLSLFIRKIINNNDNILI